MGKPFVLSVNIGLAKGEKKRPVEKVSVIVSSGVDGDAHAGPGDRQVSLLAWESIEKMRMKGLDVVQGDFAENLTIKGIRLWEHEPGEVMKIGKDVVLRITRIGKECHRRCGIFYQAGDCIMPREGIFAEVLCGGEVRPGDEVMFEKKIIK